MAIFDETDKSRLVCNECGSNLFEEKPIYAYLKKDNGDLQSTLAKTLIECMYCRNVVHEVPNKNTILR